MIPLKQVVASTVGRKFVMALSGLALVGFLCVHLLGNLFILSPNIDHINMVGEHYKSLGPLFYVAEWGLFGLFAFHAILGAVLWKTSVDARETRYAVAETKGGNSRWNISSRNMMLLGLVIITFVVVHVLQFRYQMFTSEHFKTMLEGREVEDLHGIVFHTFSNPLWVAFYMGVMFFVGFHLRHGIWSMFQSVGAMPTVYANILYAGAALAATLLAAGFFLLPLLVYLKQIMQ